MTSTSWYQTVDAAVTRSAAGAEVMQAFDPARAFPFEQGGPPVFTVCYYRAPSSIPHWHLVTYGLSTDDSTTMDGPVGGRRLELSFRLRCSDGEDVAPMWSILLLRYVARVVRKGMPLEIPSVLPPLPKPITHAGPPPDDPRESGLRAILVEPDPTLDAPGIRFAQLFGLYPQEFEALAGPGGRQAGVARIRAANPELVTDPWRAPYDV